jgi:serine/threonine protein kinase/tetratricopeptide (TPR) repeat protein
MECPKCHSHNPDDTRFCGMCATELKESERAPASPAKIPPPAKTELASGSTFAGRYQIIEELGKGGMGKVYKVWDTEVREKVALKLLNPLTAGDEKTIERFRNELKLARQIAHRNVCRMYHLAREDETYYITMECVAGEDLKSSIRRMGPLSIGKAISIAQQVCRGLSEAHRLGVIHRDLKPHNIMVDREGNARIMDFGIARSLRTKGITDTGVVVGTPEYMSPEQVEGKQVDQRSDIYSLGAILFEMITGKVPFDGDTPLSIAVKHTTTASPDPRELNHQIPEELSRVILRCMEKDKRARYQSAQDLLARLTQVEQGISTAILGEPRAESKASREITLSFSPKRILVPSLALSVMLIVGLVVWQILSREPAMANSTAKPSLAVLPFENNSQDPSWDYWRMGLPELITADLIQSRLLCIPSSERTWGVLRKLGYAQKEQHSLADLRKVATRTRVEYVLTGGIFPSGRGLAIAAVLQNPHTGLVLSSRRIECRDLEDLPVKIDELTRRIKLDFRLPPDLVSEDIDQKLTQIVTGSGEAFKYYIQGRTNWLDGGPADQTIGLMQQALASDPQFALAYRAMAGAYNEKGSISQAWKCLKRVCELKSRLSVREYYLAQGELRSMSEQTVHKAIEAYRHLLKIYPEDAEARFNLGFLLSSDLERWDEAAECFQALVQRQPETPEPYAYLAQACMAKGKYDLAREVLEECLTDFPEEIWLKERICAVELRQNRLNSALQDAQTLLASNPLSVHSLLLGDIHHCRGDWEEAEREYEQVRESKGPKERCDGELRLAALMLSQGKLDSSRAILKQAVVSAKESGLAEQRSWSHFWLAWHFSSCARPDDAMREWKLAHECAPHVYSYEVLLLYVKGLILLQMKSPEEAERVASQLKATIQSTGNQRLMRYHLQLAGRIELEKTNIAQAISYFQQAVSLLPSQYSKSDNQALFIYPLAVAYYRLGDLEKAQEHFKKIVSLTTGRLFFGNLYAKSFYWLGRIQQEKGWEQEAQRHYARFLQLWSKGDPGIPELQDAPQRQAQLKTGA